MKNISLLIGCFLVALSLDNSARALAAPPANAEAAYDDALLAAVGSLADAHLLQTRQALEILARTEEVQSGQWQRMERLVRASVPPTLPQVLWFAQPDGTYFASAGDVAAQKLSDRAYFPKLMVGETVCGELVVSKSTGQKSVIIAVPVKKDGQVMGGLGASIFVDDLSRLLNERLKLPPGSLFYALTPDGLTAFHIDPTRDFVDPRQLRNPALSDAVETILSQPAGEVTYEFNGSPRRVVFNTSALTGWRVVFGRIVRKVPE
jgi:hypothetical protein